MIKNWQKFNESYDQGSIEFTREEARAFSTYIKDDLMSWFSVKAEKELKEVIREFLLIFNEEFDSNLSVDDTQIEMIIIEPLTIDSPYSYRSLTPSAVSQSCNLIWELLKYKNYKPAFKLASINLSKSPSRTDWVLRVSTPVRKSLMRESSSTYERI